MNPHCEHADYYDAACAECVSHDETCGVLCDTCGEHMCPWFGPEPRACSTVCIDCPCECQTCVHVREELRADLLQQLAKES